MIGQVSLCCLFFYCSDEDEIAFRQMELATKRQRLWCAMEDDFFSHPEFSIYNSDCSSRNADIQKHNVRDLEKTNKQKKPTEFCSVFFHSPYPL